MGAAVLEPPDPHDLDYLTDADLPRQFGRHRLVGLLGQGGMARVFRARFKGPGGFEKEVALKILRRSMPGREYDPARLFQEARLGAALNHPNIVQTLDCGQVAGRPYIAMELIEGEALGDLLKRRGAPPPSVALEIAIAIARGIQAAHELEIDGERVGLIHRDLKPGNVLIGQGGSVRVTDFGIAKADISDAAVTATGFTHGTPAYMSPEQAFGEELDQRSDVFALGVLLFEVFTGRALFQRPTILGALAAVTKPEKTTQRQENIDALEKAIPGLAGVLRAAVRSEPRDRYPDVASLVVALESLRGATPVGPTIHRWVEESPPPKSGDFHRMVPDPRPWEAAPGGHADLEAAVSGRPPVISLESGSVASLSEEAAAERSLLVSLGIEDGPSDSRTVWSGSGRASNATSWGSPDDSTKELGALDPPERRGPPGLLWLVAAAVVGLTGTVLAHMVLSERAPEPLPVGSAPAVAEAQPDVPDLLPPRAEAADPADGVTDPAPSPAAAAHVPPPTQPRPVKAPAPTSTAPVEPATVRAPDPTPEPTASAEVAPELWDPTGGAQLLSPAPGAWARGGTLFRIGEGANRLGDAVVHYRVDRGPWKDAPMVRSPDRSWRFTLPAIEGDALDYYFSVEGGRTPTIGSRIHYYKLRR